MKWIDDQIPIPGPCQRCEKYLTCRAPCPAVDAYANQDYRSGEIPLSALSIAADEIADTAGPTFCSAPDHGFKRQARARIPELNLPLKKESALMLLASTDKDYTVQEVSEACGVPFRQLLYLGEKVGLGKGFGK